MGPAKSHLSLKNFYQENFVNKQPLRIGWVLAGLTGLAFILAACQSMSPVISTATPNPTKTEPAPTAAPTSGPTSVPATQVPITLKDGKTTASGLQYQELTSGTGAAPQSGYIVTMNYIATLPDGTELGNSYTAGGPVSTVWGKKLLLPGWEEGIGLMKVGGKTKMV